MCGPGLRFHVENEVMGKFSGKYQRGAIGGKTSEGLPAQKTWEASTARKGGGGGGTNGRQADHDAPISDCGTMEDCSGAD